MALSNWRSGATPPAIRDLKPVNIMNTAAIKTPLFDRLHAALTTSPYVPSRQVQIEASDGRVVLKGNVRSFFQKQMAQEAIRRIDGVQAIDNLLEVNWA
jgi:osmotically-inducible protein OsmY